MTVEVRMLPREMADLIGQYVERELRDVGKYDNRELLDESGVSDLMRLAAQIYGAGYAEGMAAQSAVEWVQRRIDRTRTELGSEQQ